MTMSDPIADMLTRIRNANTSKHDVVDIPSSKIKMAIAQILLEEGYVEKVVYNGSKAYLSVDGTLYSIDDLKQVIDGEYLAGSNSVEKIQNILDELPKLEMLSMNEVSNVVEANNLYNGLSEYQLSLLSKDTEAILLQYVSKANELMSTALTQDNNKTETTDPVEDNNEMIEATGEAEDL